ncbi:MAG: hypothetical protein RIC55_00125 [Pirellulaceae bacterium]
MTEVTQMQIFSQIEQGDPSAAEQLDYGVPVHLVVLFNCFTPQAQ